LVGLVRGGEKGVYGEFHGNEVREEGWGDRWTEVCVGLHHVSSIEGGGGREKWFSQRKSGKKTSFYVRSRGETLGN